LAERHSAEGETNRSCVLREGSNVGTIEPIVLIVEVGLKIRMVDFPRASSNAIDTEDTL
jgi:hypothetical protein